MIEIVETRLENPEIVTCLSVLNLSQCDSQMLTFYGDTDIIKLAEHFGLDPDETVRMDRS